MTKKFNLEAEVKKIGYGVNPPTPKFIQYKNPKTLVNRFFQEGSADVVGKTPDGEDFTILDSVKSMGYWGFTDTEANIVRFWVSDNVTYDKVLFFLGHEIGHMADIYAKKVRRSTDLNCEIRADLYGWVATEALRITHKVLRGRL